MVYKLELKSRLPGLVKIPHKGQVKIKSTNRQILFESEPLLHLVQAASSSFVHCDNDRAVSEKRELLLVKLFAYEMKRQHEHYFKTLGQDQNHI